MPNILTEPVKIGNFKVPAGLLLLAGASLLAVLALTQKQKGGSDEQPANALLGLYDAALTDEPPAAETRKSISAPPSFAINPQPVNTVQQPINQSAPVQLSTPSRLIDINTAVLKYPAAKSLVDTFARSFDSGDARRTIMTYGWYDPQKETLVDEATKQRFYG